MIVWNNNNDHTVSISKDGANYSTPSLSEGNARIMNGIVQQWGNAIDDILRSIDSHMPRTWPEAVIFSESGGNPESISSAGAVGLMQILPTTAGISKSELLNVNVNLRTGVKLLNEMYSNGMNDLAAVASMYNAGYNPKTHRPWPNEGSNAKYQTEWGFRAQPGYIDSVVKANNYLITGKTEVGKEVTTSVIQKPKPSPLPILGIALLAGLVFYKK